MDERSELVKQLSIDRGDAGRDPVESESSRPWLWVVLGVAIVAAIAAVVWFALTNMGAVPVQVAIAKSVSSSGGAVSRGAALDASGYVIARRQATVSSKITGKVVAVLIEEGQRVKEGQLVARLDDTIPAAQLAQAKAQLEQARANNNAAQVAFDNAQPIFARNKEQFSKQIISAQEFDAAKASYDAARTGLDVAARAVDVAKANLLLAQRSLDETLVRAPFAGVVTVKAAQEGEMVSPVSAGGGFTRTGICTIVDMDSLEVEVDVSENFINRVHPGQDVTVKLNAYPDWTIPARVIAIIPTADRAKATVKVRIGFKENDPRILPDMGVRVAFLADNDTSAAQAAPHAVMIPSAAVQASGDTGVVFVIRENRVERRVVRLGNATDGGQLVLSGLSEDAKVAVGDLTRLDDGMRIRIVQ